MLELDLILVPFVEQLYTTLTEELQNDYKALLECEDTDIYAWLMLRGEPAEPKLQAMVQRIVQHAQQHRSSPKTL